MFEQNDKPLLKARIIIIGLLWILAAGALAMGIAYAVLIHGIYILVAPLSWIGLWIIWILARLLLSYFCDIKLIRNKLYGESNDNLSPFLGRPKVLKRGDKKEELDEEKLNLKESYETGVIAKEEYIERKNELSEKEKELNETEKKE